MIPAIPYLRLRATLVAEAPARLPPFKGSMLRGAFGHALRRTVCVMGPEQPCVSCNLRAVCVYTRLFETFIEDEPPPFLRGLSTAPRPYVFEPGEERQEFSPEDPLGFDLLLLGQAVELQGYAALAIERMARAGLGVRRVPFRLESLRYEAAGGELLEGWDSRGRQWMAQAPAVLPALEGATAEQDSESVTLRFLTPTRIQVRKRPVEQPGFRLLAFHMLRRALEVAHFHLPGVEIDWDFEPPLERANDVEVSHRLTWRDWDRYSNRQGRKMTLGGFVGEMTLRGELEPFGPLLRAAEILHVGKGATFGLGKVQVV